MSLYGSSILFAIAHFKYNTLFLNIITIVLIAVFLYFAFKSQQCIENIATKANTIIEPGTTIALVVAFPFYFIIYYLNKMAIKKITTTHNNAIRQQNAFIAHTCPNGTRTYSNSTLLK